MRRAPPSTSRRASFGAHCRSSCRQTERVARRHGLTTERYQLLLFIKLASRDDGGATVGELADRISTSQTAPSPSSSAGRRISA